MGLKSLFALQLTASGHFETLFGARFRLHFWHKFPLLGTIAPII
jgi:hypothetical protein